LAGLYRGGFFNRAAFYGGACLRIFYGLQRFGEDMYFSLLQTDADFRLENYFVWTFRQKREFVRHKILSNVVYDERND
jgi:hypothetical protein